MWAEERANPRSVWSFGIGQDLDISFDRIHLVTLLNIRCFLWTLWTLWCHSYDFYWSDERSHAVFCHDPTVQISLNRNLVDNQLLPYTLWSEIFIELTINSMLSVHLRKPESNLPVNESRECFFPALSWAKMLQNQGKLHWIDHDILQANNIQNGLEDIHSFYSFTLFFHCYLLKLK